MTINADTYRAAWIAAVAAGETESGLASWADHQARLAYNADPTTEKLYRVPAVAIVREECRVEIEVYANTEAEAWEEAAEHIKRGISPGLIGEAYESTLEKAFLDPAERGEIECLGRTDAD